MDRCICVDAKTKMYTWVNDRLGARELQGTMCPNNGRGAFGLVDEWNMRAMVRSEIWGSWWLLRYATVVPLSAGSGFVAAERLSK